MMEPFQDKTADGLARDHRYHQGHERRIEGFAGKSEAVDWITANATKVDK